MSEYSTSSPSMEQTRLYLTRPPSVACTWWNRMSLSSVAEYSFTPMLTRPNETAPRQIDRMSLSSTATGSRSQDRCGHPFWAGRRPCGLPRPSLPHLVLLGRRHRTALDRVVGELQDVGAGHHRHGERGQAGGLRRR